MVIIPQHPGSHPPPPQQQYNHHSHPPPQQPQPPPHQYHTTGQQQQPAAAALGLPPPHQGQSMAMRSMSSTTTVTMAAGSMTGPEAQSVPPAAYLPAVGGGAVSNASSSYGSIWGVPRMLQVSQFLEPRGAIGLVSNEGINCSWMMSDVA